MIKQALAADYVVEGDVATLQYIEVIVKNFLNIAVRIAGIAVFVMLVIGGFKYLTSGSDPKAKESARKTITSAIFGLVLILGAWFILNFIEKFTGVPVTQFEFPSAP